MARKAIRMLGVALLFLGVVIVSQPAAMAEVTMLLTAPTGSSTDYMYGIYLSPYSAKIGGASTSTPIICDDFFDDTYIGEQWSATVTLGSANDLTTTEMAKRLGASDSQMDTDYNAIAWLALQLPALPVNSPSYDQALYSFAIWDIFDDAAVKNWLDAYSAYAFYTDVYNKAQYALTTTSVQAQGDRSLLTIYSADATPAPTCGSQSCPSAPPQEFFVVNTPETSATAFLAFDLLALCGAVFLVRRRALWNAGGHH
ncbi:MAG TPA: hypothetical protein VKF63_02140 [Terracidiphilus sp.]|nr:hypothetical protein [Terracidiphilus sp.]